MARERGRQLDGRLVSRAGIAKTGLQLEMAKLREKTTLAASARLGNPGQSSSAAQVAPVVE